jgi:hypothetical protein
MRSGPPGATVIELDVGAPDEELVDENAVWTTGDAAAPEPAEGTGGDTVGSRRRPTIRLRVRLTTRAVTVDLLE